MTDYLDELAQCASSMAPSAAEIALRQRFLELGPDDEALLRAIPPCCSRACRPSSTHSTRIC